MKFGSVCSGIEAASVAWHPLGWKAAWFSEIEPFPSAVLAHHYPDVPNLGDMTALPERIASGQIEAPDVLAGGTPCQAFSVAGLRKSLADERGNLTLKFVEIADAIDFVRARDGRPPAIVFWENVPGVLSTKDNAFGCFLAGLAGEDCELKPPGKRWTDAGCVFGPQRAIAWRVLDAQYFGLAQRRRRVFVVASAREGFDPAAVLFEFEGVRRDTAPRREAGKVAPTIPSRSTGGGGLGTDFDCDGGLIHADPIARCDTAGEAKRQDWETCNFVAHSLRGEGFAASEDGTGRGTPLVPVAMINMQGSKGNAVAQADGPSFTLNAMHGHDMHAVAVPVGVTIHGTDPTVQKVASYDELAQCLRARTPGNIDNSSTTVVQQPVAYGIRTANTSSNGWGIQEEAPHTLDCAQGVAVAQPVAFAQNSRNELRLEGGDGQRCGALSTGGGKPGQGVPMIAFHPTQDPISSTDGSTHALGCGSTGGQASVAVAVSLRGEGFDASEDGTGRGTPMLPVAFQPGNLARGAGSPPSNEVFPTLKSDHGRGLSDQQPHVMAGMAVRRLTVEECELLQGFPRGYTRIPWRGKPADQCPDGPRYKALGNSWAVPVVRWIGERINALHGVSGYKD